MKRELAPHEEPNPMPILARRRRTVTFCDRCSQTCDAGCGARAARDRHRDHALYTLGGR